MTAAALGTSLTLPTLEADLASEESSPELVTSFELEVRPGTQSGSEQTMRGFGVPSLRGGRGDLVVTIIVETPTALDGAQEELLQQLATLRGETQPSGQLRATSKGVFGRLRDVFNGH
jgi:molecular chaperone DnaJ